MRVSIIIPTLRENILYLKTTVESIKKYQTEDHEIIVVVNNIKPEEIPNEMKEIEGIKLLSLERQGQGSAVNYGVKEAINEYVLISDDDVVFGPNFEELTEKAKEVEFLSGNFTESGKKGGVAAPFITNDCGDTPEIFNWEKWEKDSMEMREEKMENGFGFPLVCKKELWNKIPYDISYDPWGSNIDSDLSYSIMLSGIMPKRYRGVLTYHFAQVSKIFIKPEALPYWDRNTKFFEQKWGIARAGQPQIWFCDFKINGNNLRYKPDFAKLENNPNIIYE